jgi:hypothetical protein
MGELRSIDTTREIELRRRLYAPKPREEIAVVREFNDAVRALSKNAEAWSAFLPRPAAVESARSTVAGLHRLLTELAALQGGPPDAAA